MRYCAKLSRVYTGGSVAVYRGLNRCSFSFRRKKLFLLHFTEPASVLNTVIRSHHHGAVSMDGIRLLWPKRGMPVFYSWYVTKLVTSSNPVPFRCSCSSGHSHTIPSLPDFQSHKMAAYRLVYLHPLYDGISCRSIWTCKVVAFPGMKPLACGVVKPLGRGPELSSRVP